MIINHGNLWFSSGGDVYVGQACRIGIITNVKKGDTLYFYSYNGGDGVSAILAINP